MIVKIYLDNGLMYSYALDEETPGRSIVVDVAKQHIDRIEIEGRVTALPITGAVRGA